MHILCTNGTPIVETLVHLPPLPVFVDYCLKMKFVKVKWESVPISREDELGIPHALRLRDRICRINLQHLRASTLHKFLMLMDGPFPKLERLSLSSMPDESTPLTLPPTFLAPNLRRLTLHGIRLPKRLRLLTSTVSLVILELMNIQASGYFRPRLLVARLQLLPQLEDLVIEFSIPIPRPSAEGLLLGEQGTPVTLSNLKSLKFRGVSAYLERLISQIRTPLLRQLDITVFNQIAFTLPHLSHFLNITEQIKFPSTAAVSFVEASSVILRHRITGWDEPNDPDEHFTLRVMCVPLDWQIDCAAQICSALWPVLSVVEKLTLNLNPIGYMTPTELQNNEIDSTTWHELLRSFIGVKELHIDRFLSEELSRALEVDDIGSDPGLLSSLQELLSETRTPNSFSSFIYTRMDAGRPVMLHLPNVLYNRPQFSQPWMIPGLPSTPPSPPSISISSPQSSP